ncbi:hypothetical protein [Alteromonas sp. P256]|uniref:hypothetical protein n=1 Tax=Alteromonas sp. P256 TaxID=3117399 RepID=UPI002FDF8CF4
MTYKFKYFAQPVITNIKTVVEAAFMEFSFGVICAVFAYVSYGEIIQLFVACTLIAIVCFFLTIHNIYVMFKIKKQQALKEDI